MHVSGVWCGGQKKKKLITAAGRRPEERVGRGMGSAV